MLLCYWEIIKMSCMFLKPIVMMVCVFILGMHWLVAISKIMCLKLVLDSYQQKEIFHYCWNYKTLCTKIMGKSILSTSWNYAKKDQ